MFPTQASPDPRDPSDRCKHEARWRLPPKTAKHLRPRISVSGRVSLRAAAEIRQHLRHQCIRRARIREQHVAGAGIVEVFYRVALAVARHPFDQCRAHPRCRPDAIVAPETSSSGPVHRSTAIAAFSTAAASSSPGSIIGSQEMPAVDCAGAAPGGIGTYGNGFRDGDQLVVLTPEWPRGY